MSDVFKQQIIDNYIRENIWNKLIKMFKILAKCSRREKNISPAGAKNIPVSNTIRPDSIPIATTATENDERDGKRIFKFFKTGFDFELNDSLIYF